MWGKLKGRLTYSSVVATLALFLALGGVSYAAVTLAPNSVGSSQLRSGSVTGSKLAFPLGIVTNESTQVVTLNTANCSPQTACPPPLVFRPPVTSVSLKLTKAARVLLIGTGEFNLNSLHASASIELGLRVGQTELPTGFQQITSTSATAVSVERVVSLPAGRETISLTASATAESSTNNPSVEGDNCQLAAVVLPGMPSAQPTPSAGLPITGSPRPVPRS